MLKDLLSIWMLNMWMEWLILIWLYLCSGNLAKIHVRLLDTLEYLKIIIFFLKKYAFFKDYIFCSDMLEN